MHDKETAPHAELVIKPCGRAFIYFYVYIFFFLIGPWGEPNFWFIAVCIFIGLLLIVLMIYLKEGQVYRITSQGVATVRHWPSPRQQVIPWENLGSIEVGQGLIQMLLRVGNLRFRDKSSGAAMRGPIMIWNAVSYPKEIKKIIEERRV